MEGYRMKNNLQSVIEVFETNNHSIDTVFDVGAHTGKWTEEYVEILPRATFYLFEANPKRTRPLSLSENHKWYNVVLSSPAISAVEFYADGGRHGTGDSYYKETTISYDNVQPITLETDTIDNIVKENNIPVPQLMKIDTQGSEIDVLKGAAKTLNGVDLLMIETPVLAYNAGSPSFDDYIEHTMEYGFVPIGVNEVHLNDGILMQLDIVFIRKELRARYYDIRKFWHGMR